MEYYAVYSSLSLATRIRKYVRALKINIVKSPHEISSGGCSYSLKFPEYLLQDIQNASRDLMVTVNGFYKLKGEKYIKIG